MPRGTCKWLLRLGVTVAVTGFASFASAYDGPEFIFEWRAPEGCPPAGEVEREIDDLLGGPAHDHVRAALRVQAKVEHGAAWSLALETASRTASGHRTIEAATCQGLAHATALIVALMIDPDAVAARSSRSADDASPPPSPPTASATMRVPPVPRGGGTRTTTLLVGVVAAGNLGLLPTPDVGAGVSAGVIRPGWRIEARAAYGPRWVRSDTLTDPPGAYGRFSLIVGTVQGCVTFVGPRVDMGPCAVAELGVVRGQGFRTSQTASNTSPWFGLGVGGFVALKATPWLYFPVHADAVAPLWRPRYVFQNVPSPIFQSWLVGGRLTAGVELRF